MPPCDISPALYKRMAHLLSLTFFSLLRYALQYYLAILLPEPHILITPKMSSNTGVSRSSVDRISS